MLAGWNGTVMSLGQLRSSLGWERNGRFEPGLDAASLPAPASAALRGGRRLTGIDTGLGGRRYGGSAPGVGAGEPRAR